MGFHIIYIRIYNWCTNIKETPTGQTLQDAAWYYPQPYDAAKNIKDYIAFCMIHPFRVVELAELRETEISGFKSRLFANYFLHLTIDRQEQGLRQCGVSGLLVPLQVSRGLGYEIPMFLYATGSILLF